MEWTDEAIVLAVRPFGEHSGILEALTRAHGRHLGLMRSAGSRRMRGVLEAGNLLNVHWRARIDQQLGSYAAELSAARAAHFFDDRVKLDALSSACAMCSATLPEREAHERVYLALDGLLRHMVLEPSLAWAESYVRFEMVLLEDLGFGLDLSACVVTGDVEGLAYVSPRSGRAVTVAGAGIFARRLLKLPTFLTGAQGETSLEDVKNGLSLTGHFLERVLDEANGQGKVAGLPEARVRFSQRIEAL